MYVFVLRAADVFIRELQQKNMFNLCNISVYKYICENVSQTLKQ